MKKTGMKLWLPVAAAGIAAALGFTLVHGDDHGREREHRERGHSLWPARQDVPPARDQNYLAECASCHDAYAPALLPARSWHAVMAGLGNHFGDNASLPPETVAAIERYLVANAADTGEAGRGERLNNSLRPDQTPLRITETPYFRRKHHELPERVVRENPQVRSFSQCAACHTRAAEGSFDEHEVRIPGVGRWD